MRSVMEPRTSATHERDQRMPDRQRRARATRRSCVGEVGGRVGAEADERRLAERRQAGDAGEQHQAERDEL